MEAEPPAPAHSVNYALMEVKHIRGFEIVTAPCTCGGEDHHWTKIGGEDEAWEQVTVT